MVTSVQRRLLSGLLVAVLPVLTLSCSSNPASKAEVWEAMVDYPVHHFYSGPVNERVYKLSPDGKKLASLKAHGDFINLVITDLASGESQLATNFDDVMVTGFTWANNDRLLFYTSDELAINAVDYDGGTPRTFAITRVVCKDECLATEEPVFLVNYMQVLSRLPADPDHVLVTSNFENILQPDLYKLNINTGKAFVVKADSDKQQLYRWPTDGEGRVLEGDPGQHEVVSFLQFNPATKEWTEVPADTDAARQPVVNPDIARRLARLKREFAVEDIHFSSIDDNQTRAVLMVASAPSAPDYYLYEFADQSISLLAEAPMEVAMIEEDPSRIRVELIVVNDTYQQRSTNMARPLSRGPLGNFSRSTAAIAARKAVSNLRK